MIILIWTRMRILLVSAEPIPTTSRVQHNTLQLVSPTKNHHIDLLTIQPKTRNEINLLAALRESEARVQSLKNRVVERQATNILNEMYCDTLRRQLAHQEKKKSGLKGKGKLVGDGKVARARGRREGCTETGQRRSDRSFDSLEEA
jgi:hypothetical protein